MIGFLKRLFCEHDYAFRENLHGDPVIFIHGFNRSAWSCRKCGKRQLRPHLHYEAGGKPR